MVSSIATYYNLTLKAGANFSHDPAPLQVFDDRTEGPTFGNIPDKMGRQVWALRWPNGAKPMEVFQLQEAWQATGKGTLPMTWTPPGDTEKNVVFDMTSLQIAPMGAQRFRVGDVILREWHG